MSEPAFDYVQAIAEHSAAFAAAAEGNLAALVEHCPGWTVADLVEHLTGVQWFWATIAAERLAAPPDEARRPPPAPPERLIAVFREGADRLVRVLREADGGDPVWTWAPAQRDIAFITRHQVQEAAVHQWDAVHAAGGNLLIEPPVAVDSIDEFLTFSVSSEADPAEPPRPPLNGAFALRCTDADARWTIHDGGVPGTVAAERRARPGTPVISATAADLLLWLYGRVSVDTSAVPEGLTGRFRALCFTS
jgi:uncharacterized protein (TIGR03083 family)